MEMDMQARPDDADTQAVRPYEIFGVKGRDLFVLVRLINRIGLKQIVEVFTERPELTALDAEGMSEAELTQKVGYSTVIEVVGLLLENLPNCEADVYSFMAEVSNLSPDEVADLPAGMFVSMIVDILESDDFSDFFTQASRLAGLANSRQ